MTRNLINITREFIYIPREQILSPETTHVTVLSIFNGNAHCFMTAGPERTVTGSKGVWMSNTPERNHPFYTFHFLLYATSFDFNSHCNIFLL